METKAELLSKLYAMEKGPEKKFETPADVVAELIKYRKKKTETFVVLTVDNKNNLTGKKAFPGTVDQAAVYPREIFRFALLKQATGIFLAHNHPGGDAEPSRHDRFTMDQLKGPAEILGIRILDHIILSRHGHYSFQEHGLI